MFVDQPSVAQTVSILRGLRERYEVHHGVRISDSALVEAAVLSDRCVARAAAVLLCCCAAADGDADADAVVVGDAFGWCLLVGGQ